jgi:hypothetical protein
MRSDAAAGGDLTGAFPNQAIADGAVTIRSLPLRWAWGSSQGG